MTAGVGWVPAPQVRAHTLVGAGDAFAVGLALRLERSASLEGAVTFAAAVAAAHAEPAAGEFSRGRVDALASALRD